MLTQGLALDANCMLNISSFLTLPLLLDCPISTRNSMSVVMLLKMIGEWNRVMVMLVGVMVDFYQDACEGTGGGYYLMLLLFTCAFVFCSLISSIYF